MKRKIDHLESRKQEILSQTSGLIARHLNKRISLPISTWLAQHTRLRPNQITYFNMVIGISTLPIAAYGTKLAIAIAATIFQIVSILDGVDGEIAKLTDQSSKWGQWLDTISDNLSLGAFLFGLFLGLRKLYPYSHITVLGGMALLELSLLLSILFIFLKTSSDSGSLVTFDKKFLKGVSVQEFPKVAPLVQFLKYMIKKDFFSFLFFVIAICGRPLWILYIVCFGLLISLLFLGYIYAVRHWRLGTSEGAL